jgi:phenylalanyl-tRNA synthetase beta subunit
LQEYILSYRHNNLKEVYIFDFFYNEKKNEIKIGFRFVFQSNKKTLEYQEVNELMNIIINHTTSMDGIKIPGIE